MAYSDHSWVNQLKMRESYTLYKDRSKRLISMPITIRAKDITKMISKALSFLAVFMLVVVGGTYAHADKPAHQHEFVEDSINLAMPEHSHINNAGLVADVSSDIHCGGLIFFPQTHQGIHYVLQNTKPMILADQRLTSISNELDPPPPRLFS